jgi:CspA family cold shock protein
MAQGTIKRLTDRGFGFIAQEGSDKDLFFHSSELVGVDFNDLKEGDAVTFEIGESEGPNDQSRKSRQNLYFENHSAPLEGGVFVCALDFCQNV